MALNKIKCPDCGAGLKSSAGFTAGEEVECPKCESAFTVEAPEDDEAPVKTKVKAGIDDDDDDVPKKKKKKIRDDEERSYKTSPARYAVLGVLVVVMIVLGVMLVMKRQRDKETEEANAKIQSGENSQNGPAGGFGPNPPPPNPVGMGGPGMGGPPKIPSGAKQPNFPIAQNGPTGGNGILADTPFAGSPEAKQLMATLRQKLVGTWEGTGPDGATQKVTYQANGQFTLDANGKTTSGTWQAASLVGGRVLKITRGTAALKVAFEGDELLHDTETPGVTVVMKKK